MIDLSEEKRWRTAEIDGYEEVTFEARELNRTDFRIFNDVEAMIGVAEQEHEEKMRAIFIASVRNFKGLRLADNDNPSAQIVWNEAPLRFVKEVVAMIVRVSMLSPEQMGNFSPPSDGRETAGANGTTADPV